jgi:hypothetical protein
MPQHMSGGGNLLASNLNNNSAARRKSYTGTIELGKSPGTSAPKSHMSHHSKFAQQPQKGQTIEVASYVHGGQMRHTNEDVHSRFKGNSG